MNDKKWKKIAFECLLILGTIAAIFLRVKEVDLLQDKYLCGYDAYFYYRQAKTIIDQGKLPDLDYMQNSPDGLNLRGRSNLNCYAIAYLYKGVRIFAPEISIERVAIYYPVICFALILIVFFALTNLLFNKSIALLAVTIFGTIPGAVIRTHAGWADRDPLSLLVWLVCLYFYVAAYQTLSQDRRYLWLAFLSGVSIGTLGLTWPGVGLLSIIIVAFNSVKLLTQSYDEKKFYVYLCWYIPSVLIMLIFTERYSVNPHRAYTLAEMALPTIFAIIVPTIFTVVVGLSFLIRKVKNRTARRVLWGLVVTNSVILMFVLVPPQEIIDTFLHPAGTDSFIATVSEFREPEFSHWFLWYRLFFIFPLLGLLLVTNTVTKTYRMPAKAVPGMLAIAVTAMILSTHPKLQYELMDVIRLGFVILCIGIITVSYFWHRFNRPANISTYIDLLLLLLIWALFTLLYTCGAVRFALFLVPPAVTLGAYAIMFILRHVADYDENRILSLTMLMCFMVLTWQLRTMLLACLLKISLDTMVASLVCLILIVIVAIFSLFRGSREFSMQRKSSMIAKATCLVLSIVLCVITGGIPYLLPNWASLKVIQGVPKPDEIKALNWLKTHTPVKSVVAAWWVQGSRIQALAERATIVDQQHNIPRIRSMAREVFCAETPEEALKFLKFHKATHLVFHPKEMFRLAHIFTIGSPQDTERNILVEQFSTNKHTRDSSVLFQEKSTQQTSPRPFQHSNPLEYTTERYLSCSQGDTSTKYVYVEYRLDRSFHKASVHIDDMNISPAYVIFDGKKEKNLHGSGVLVVTNVDVHDPHQTLEYRHAVYFNEKAYNLLAFKLYFLGSYTDHFKQVYPTQETENIDASSFNDIKIWEINY